MCVQLIATEYRELASPSGFASILVLHDQKLTENNDTKKEEN